MKVVVAGGSGFLGSAFARSLVADGHEVVVLSRSARPRGAAQPRYVAWNGRALDDWTAEIDGADAVVNFAGASVASGRWTSARKHRLRASRIEPTAALVAAMRAATRRPATFINMSAVGFYGDCGQRFVTEEAPSGEGFLAQLVVDWEATARPAIDLGVRTVFPRTGVVLGSQGALPLMALPFRLWVGGPIGSGKQWVPWVHTDDVVGLLRFALDHPEVEGPMNVAAPQPARNRELAAAIGHALGRPSWLPVPSLALQLVLGELSSAILTGQRVVPSVAQRLGYEFRQPSLLPAVRAALLTS
jgi:uncharacterized protein